MQIKRRATIAPGQALTVGDVAILAPADERAANAVVPCSRELGVWTIAAAAVAQAITQAYGKDWTLLGESTCYVHVARGGKQGVSRNLRAVLAFVLLTVGGALALTWFHADVNMMDAQYALYALLTGAEPTNKWLVVAPYTLGVGLGVGGYYALIGKRRAVSPLDMKLSEYRSAAEETAGKAP